MYGCVAGSILERILRRFLYIVQRISFQCSKGYRKLAQLVFRTARLSCDVCVFCDDSAEQIAHAKRLSEGMDIRYDAVPTEEVDFPDASFDVITACQCFWYFRHECVMPQLHRMLKPQGSLLLLYMAWLPFEDEIARASEELVLRYHPSWSGRGETMHPIEIPGCYFERFEMVHHEEFRLRVPFTRESWHGRMRACRGVGASLLKEDLAAWEREHRAMLERMAPPEFEVQHYAAIAQMKKK